jgi:uncharacterized membrane protein
MGMRVHELHAAAIHAPLVMLPTAATLDLTAALTRNPAYARLGRTLWWVGASAGLFAGLAGMAASQEVRAQDDRASDMMWLHGMGNFALVLGAFGIAGWRTARRPTVGLAVGCLAACAASFYTAYLGGEMVYGHGIGVNAMPGYTGAGVDQSPPVLSTRAPMTFLRDAIKGLVWLFRRGSQVVQGQQRLASGAFGLSEATLPSQTPA